MPKLATSPKKRMQEELQKLWDRVNYQLNGMDKKTGGNLLVNDAVRILPILDKTINDVRNNFRPFKSELKYLGFNKAVRKDIINKIRYGLSRLVDFHSYLEYKIEGKMSMWESLFSAKKFEDFNREKILPWLEAVIKKFPVRVVF